MSRPQNTELSWKPETQFYHMLHMHFYLLVTLANIKVKIQPTGYNNTVKIGRDYYLQHFTYELPKY